MVWLKVNLSLHSKNELFFNGGFYNFVDAVLQDARNLN